MKQSHRITYLDGIRGLAALTIVNSHLIGAYGMPESLVNILTYTPLHIFWDGFAAVSLFFVLSGLVLSLKYFDISSLKKASPHLSLKTFYISRTSRMLLPYVAVLTLSLICQKYFFVKYTTAPEPSLWISQYYIMPYGFKEYIRQAILVLGRPEATKSLMPQDWMLRTMLNLSYLLPFLILIAQRNIFWLLTCGISLIFLFNVDYFIFHFMLGIIIAKYFTIIQMTITKLHLPSKIALFIFGLFLYTFRFSVVGCYPNVFTERMIFSTTGAGSCLLLISVISFRSIQKILSINFVGYIGKISYSLYLIHFLIILIVTPKILSLLNQNGITENFARLVAFCITIFFTIIMASVLYYSVEIPSMLFGNRLSLLVNQTRRKK